MLENLIKAALGSEKCDTVLKNGKIIDVLGHKIIEGSVGIKDGIIVGIGDYEADEETDVNGAYIAPGFVDSHLHIESSMLTPSGYAMAVMPKGVTTIIADPHEIANVCGEKGLEFMLEDSKNTPLEVHFMLPSCVPATPFDHNGCVIDGELTEKLFSKYNFSGLGEMMNYPGVLACDSDVIRKLGTSEQIDGHCPGLTGRELNAYICAGIKNDHECTDYKEALEKLSNGLDIFIREGTGSKNLEELIKAVTPYNLRHFSFCTDDKESAEILSEGTISHCIDKAISLGCDPLDAYTIACYNPCVSFSLGRKGAIASGYEADIVITKDINATQIERVYKKGRLVALDGKPLFERVSADSSRVENTVNVSGITAESLDLEFDSSRPVISFSRGSLVTEKVYCDSAEGLSLCANIERHKNTGNIGKCFIKGFSITNGAVAQTIGHDSHNISVLGSDSENMAAAVNALGKQGGIAVVQNRKVIAFTELPVGGLMSLRSAEETAKDYEKTVEAVKGLSPHGSSEALMILSFVSLLVIPHLKLGDKGLFDVDNFCYI